MLCKYSILAIDHIIKKFKISIDNDIYKYNTRENEKNTRQIKEQEELFKHSKHRLQTLQEEQKKKSGISEISEISENNNQFRTSQLRLVEQDAYVF